MGRPLSRRDFLAHTAACSLGVVGLRRSYASDGSMGRPREDFGPLLDDPDGILALPRGFRYTIVSRRGDLMDDGLRVPGRHDGMATFPGPAGLTLLVRNHEVNAGDPASQGPWGEAHELLGRVDRRLLYDAGGDDAAGPCLGGTTTLLYDTRRQRLVSHHLSLTGTLRNCAGGPTPWGTWITCEETTLLAGDGRARDHGYNFEVAARPGGGLQGAVPLRSMGRFNHEAVAVHPPSGIVYQTEDDGEGLLYRFIPDRPGDLAAGGRLQALGVRGRPSLDTRRWQSEPIATGEGVPVQWIDLEEVESPGDDLRFRGFEAGAARFARGEGMWWSDGVAWFACTNGGRARKGQIWRYEPSPWEGARRENERPGRLELFLEPNDGRLVENADNLCSAPWGDLVVCEDGSAVDHLVGVTPSGDLYKLARNMMGSGELAGSCFSPDGSTLFVNMQLEGWTVAITGPWRRP